VPFVWLLFAWRRRFKVYDHVVFVTYSIAFMTLFLVALSLIRATIGGGLNETALLVVPPVHMYRSSGAPTASAERARSGARARC